MQPISSDICLALYFLDTTFSFDIIFFYLEICDANKKNKRSGLRHKICQGLKKASGTRVFGH